MTLRVGDAVARAGILHAARLNTLMAKNSIKNFLVSWGRFIVRGVWGALKGDQAVLFCLRFIPRLRDDGF